MSRDQENRFEILRVTTAAEAESLEAAELAASVLLEEDVPGADYLIIDRDGSYVCLLAGRGMGLHVRQSGTLDRTDAIPSRGSDV